MFPFLFLGFLGQALCRKRNLHIENDRRQFIPLSTFGFYTGGKLQVNMTGFKMDKSKVLIDGNEEMVVGFSIDKTVSDALNPYVQATETQCILTKQPAEKGKGGRSLEKGLNTCKSGFGSPKSKLTQGRCR